MTQPYQPAEKDAGQVKLLIAMGIPAWDVAKVIGVSEPTLRKYFAREIELGTIEPNAKVANSLYKQATDPIKPNVVAAIFWLKCRAGWVEAAAGTEQPGKKEMREQIAKTADQGTSWEGLLQ